MKMKLPKWAIECAKADETPIQAETKMPVMKRLKYERHPYYGNGKFCKLCRCIQSHTNHTVAGEITNAASHLNQSESTTADPKPKTSLPYKLGGTDDPHFVDHTEELSRTEAACDWYDHLRDDGRSDGQGESYSERNT